MRERLGKKKTYPSNADISQSGKQQLRPKSQNDAQNFMNHELSELSDHKDSHRRNESQQDFSNEEETDFEIDKEEFLSILQQTFTKILSSMNPQVGGSLNQLRFMYEHFILQTESSHSNEINNQ